MALSREERRPATTTSETGFCFVHSPAPGPLPRGSPRPTERASRDGSLDPDFESSLQFVNVGTYDESRSLKTRKIVRGHVMKKVRQAQRDLRVQRSLQSGQRAGSRSPTPNSMVSPASFDPFDSYPIELPPQVRELVNHWIYDFLGNQLPFHHSKYTDNPLAKVVLPLAFTTPALLNAVLCITSAWIGAKRGVPIPDSTTLMYHGEAIRYLREGFEIQGCESKEQGISDGAIMAIITLSTYEVFIGDAEALDYHARGLYRMVAMSGGLEKLGMSGQIKTMVLWADQFGRLLLRRESGYSMAHTTRAYCMQQNLSQEEIQSLSSPGSPGETLDVDLDEGEGFRKARNQGLLPPFFARHLEQWCVSASMEQQERERDIFGHYGLTRSGNDLDEFEVSLRALSFHDQAPGSYEQVCFLAATMYNNMISRDLSPTSATQVSLAEELKEALEECDADTAFSQNLELLLWILFAASALETGDSIRSWFRQEIKGYTSWLRTALGFDWNGMRQMLNKFLWCGHRCEERGRNLWEEILDES